MMPAALIALLSEYRFSLSDEIRTQDEIATALADDGISFEREVILSPKDRIDFLIGEVGLEIKLKGQKLAIYRQVERYCASPRVGAIILAANVAMGLPSTIAGKPAHFLLLGRAWL